MKVVLSKRSVTWMTAVLLVVVLLYNLPFLLLNEPFLTKQVRSKLQNYFQQRGFRFEVANVRWVGNGRFEAKQIGLVETQSSQLLLRADRLIIRTNWTAALRNLSHPELVLEDFEVIRPQLHLKHYKNRTWNFSGLFRKGKRRLSMNMKLRIDDGLVQLDDYKFGKHQFAKVDGELDFHNYPLIGWDLKGESNFGKAVTWKSSGQFRTDQLAGQGKLSFVNLPLQKAILLTPWRYPFKLKTGIAKGTVDFGWNKQKLWFQKGQAVLENTVVKFPRFCHDLRIITARTDFAPELIKVKHSEINYQKTKVNLDGTLDPLQQTIDARVKSRSARLEDLLEMFPAIPRTVINGRANFQLHITGLINNPVFNGAAAIAQTRVASNGEVFSKVHGKLLIRKNNIQISKLKALWHEAWVHAQGNIYNIYNPRLDLKVHGNGVVLEQFALVRQADPNLKFCRTANFEGKFTGFWDNPVFSGAVFLEQLQFYNISLQQLKTNFTWEPMATRVKVFSLESRVGAGRLTADGRVVADANSVSWDLKAKIEALNLNEVKLFPDGTLTGTVLTASALLKGSWQYDSVFEPGTVMGVFKGRQLAYQNLVADEVSGVYSWDQGNLSIDTILLKSGSGHVFGNLTLNRGRLSSNLDAENIKLSKVLSGEQIPVDGIFNGNLKLEGDLPNLTGRLEGEFADLAWDSKSIGKVTGILEYQQSNKEIQIVNLMLNNPSGNYQINGRVVLAERIPQLEFEVASENLNLERLLDYLPAKPQPQIEGFASTELVVQGPLTAPSFSGRINLNRLVVAGIPMDTGRLVFHGDLNRIQITQCELNSADFHIFAMGALERDNLKIDIGAGITNLEGFRIQYNGNRLKGRLNLEGKLEGSFEQPVLTATLRGEEISFGDFNYPLLRANIRWAAPQLEIYNTELTGVDDSISASGKIYTSKPVRFDLGLDVNNFKIRELLHLAKLEQVAASGNFSGKMMVSGTLDDPKIRLDGEITAAQIGSIPVNGELALFYTGNQLFVEKIGLIHEAGSFYASGVWEKDKTLKLEGRLSHFPLQTINRFIKNPQLNLDGSVNAAIVLEWSESLLKCEYQMNFDNLQVNKEKFGVLSLNGYFNETGFTVASGDLLLKNGDLELAGFIPWPEELRHNLKFPTVPGLKNKLDLRMTLKSIPASLINTVADGFLVGKGSCDGNLNFTGTLTKPEIAGNLVFSDVQLEFPELPFLVDAITASVTLKHNRAVINRAVGYTNNGRIDLAGEVEFSNPKELKLNLDCQGSRVYFKNFFFDGFSDFSVKLAGEFNDAVLMGNLTLYNCKMGGLTIGGGKKGKNEWNPRIDLMVTLGKKVRFRQIGVADVSVNGAVNVRGTLAEPALGGEVKATQGVVTFYSQTFKVNRGEATFNYAQGINPFVDIEASLMTPKAEIFLKLKGQVGSEIMPMLSSQPALSQKEIFALLNWSDLVGEKPLTVDSIVEGNMNMVTDTLFGDILYQIRDRIGFDYLYLETDYRSNEYRLNFGDHITDRLFLSYTWAVISETDKEDKWAFDYYLTPKMAAGGSYSITEGYTWKLSYTFQF